MKWTELEIENFLSFKKAKLKLENQGLVLVEGLNKSSDKFERNGVGKTAIFDAIVYALFDTTSKGLKADEIVNNKVGKNTCVRLTGYDGYTEYRIERYRKHSKHKNKVLLFRDGKDITEKSNRDTNKAIEKLVGIDYKTFINSIMFSQGQGAGRFAQASDKEKKEILENLVNLEIYARAQELAKEKVKEKEQEISEKEHEGERLQWELEQVDILEQQDFQKYEDTKKLIKEEQLNIGKLTDEMADYASNNFPKIEKIKEEIEELKEQRDNMNTVNIDSYYSRVEELRKQLEEFNSQQRNLELQKDQKVSNYRKLQLDTHCPVCGNELNPVHREQEMEKIKEELRQVLIQMQTVQLQAAPIEQQYNEALEDYNKFKKIYDQTNARYQNIVNQIQEREKSVREYETTLQYYKDQIQSKKDMLEKLQNLPKPQKRDKERESIREKIKAHKEQLLSLEKEKKKLEDAVKVFSNSGVKSHVLDLITPYLNERANIHLSALSGPDMEVRFSTQTKNKDGSYSDKFDLQLTNRVGGDTYKSNSEGERKRADLAISLAIQDLLLSKSNKQTNMVIYDEVFDALDSVGCENVIALLKERLDTVPTIFVVTHSEHLKPLFEKTITVVKDKDGISTIEGGEPES